MGGLNLEVFKVSVLCSLTSRVIPFTAKVVHVNDPADRLLDYLLVWHVCPFSDRHHVLLWHKSG